jgi:hypothetical protein
MTQIKLQLMNIVVYETEKSNINETHRYRNI